MRRRVLLGAVSTVSLIGLAACQQEMAITVTMVGGVPMFEVQHHDRPCLNSVKVARDGDQRLSWYVAATNPTTCLRQVRYGVAPDGFRQVVAPAGLVRGTTYKVVVKRPGAIGIESFVVP